MMGQEWKSRCGLSLAERNRTRGALSNLCFSRFHWTRRATCRTNQPSISPALSSFTSASATVSLSLFLSLSLTLFVKRESQQILLTWRHDPCNVVMICFGIHSFSLCSLSLSLCFLFALSFSCVSPRQQRGDERRRFTISLVVISTFCGSSCWSFLLCGEKDASISIAAR